MDKKLLITCIELVELDQRILQITQEQAQNILIQAQLVEQKSQIKQHAELMQKKAQDAKKAIDLLELELKVVDTKLVKTQEKLQMAKNIKESNSLDHEIAALALKKSELENQGLQLIAELEASQSIAIKARDQAPEKEQEIQEKIDEIDARKLHLKSLQGAYIKNREQLAQAVPEEFLSQYEGMRDRVPNPVVPIINGGCSGCFYGLNRQELIKAEHGSLITCHGCYRMLYIFKSVQDTNNDEQSIA